MKPGTPGFQGARLIEAREARSITAVALADMLGVTRQTVSQYEKGQHTPQPAVMVKMTQVLNLPSTFFLREPTAPLSGVIFARSQASATKAPRKRAERRHEWARLIAEWLREYLNFPNIDFPDLKPPLDPALISGDWLEHAAELTRRHWGMGDGPIPNVTLLLEQKGAVVSFSDFGTEELDAFSDCGKTSYLPHISLSSEKRLSARINYTAAHELAHLVLHRNIPDNVAKRKIEHALIERQADAFAGAFLLPARTFSSMARHVSLEMFQTLKSFWRVSIGALLMRARALGLVSEERYATLWAIYNKKGWRRREPLDDELTFGTPTLLRQSFDLLVKERVFSRQEIRASLPFGSADIEKLCGLDEDYLSEDRDANIVSLPSTRSVRPSNGERAAILPFERN